MMANGGVDSPGQVEIRDVLSKLGSRGATLFANSHLLSETERRCAYNVSAHLRLKS